MQKKQRHWRPDPFWFQDQITFQGRPTGKKKNKFPHVTPGMVQKLRAVTRARRRIWDKEARRWDLRFPIKDTTFEKIETFGVSAKIRNNNNNYNKYNNVDQDPTVDPQEALLDSVPKPDMVNMPIQILSACVCIQKHIRGRLAYQAVRSSLTYPELMRWSRLHRLSVHCSKMNAKAAVDRKVHHGLAQLQGIFRGWRGRGKARFVKHRVWSAAARIVQLQLLRPYLVRFHARQMRACVRWQYMSQRMMRVQQIQIWYRTQREGRLARAVISSMRAETHRQEVITRMSQTYGFHITTTGKWKAMKKLAAQADELQWTTKYATMMQAVVRAWGAKKATQLLRTAKARRIAREVRSAIVIQSLWRGYVKRTEVIKRAYHVVQEAARRRWVVRSSDNIHRNELLEIEIREREKITLEQIQRQLRTNVLAYTIKETPKERKKREKERMNYTFYDGPHFNLQENDVEVHVEESDLEEESDNDSPRYW